MAAVKSRSYIRQMRECIKDRKVTMVVNSVVNSAKAAAMGLDSIVARFTHIYYCVYAFLFFFSFILSSSNQIARKRVAKFLFKRLFYNKKISAFAK